MPGIFAAFATSPFGLFLSSSSDDEGKFYLAVTVGFFFGLITFFKGFRAYRRYRLICDVPQIPIRSVPMGLVKVRGKARGAQVISSPVSRTPCLFYKVDIERWKSDQHGGSWSHYATDADGENFYLEDATGKVIIDAHGCDYDLQETSKRELATSAGEPELRTYIQSAGAKRFTHFAEKMMSRVPNGKIDPDKSAQLQMMKDSLHLFNEQTAVNPGHMPNFLPMMMAFAAQQKLDPKYEPQRQAALAHLQELQASGKPIGGFQPEQGRFLLREYCILPDHEYEVTGTCVENPTPSDAHDRNLITKGENEATFLISWRNEKDLESTLGKKAALMIFGGAGLSVVCLTILLAKFGLLRFR
ncbi:MAG TPA: hypothetical protein VE994_15760 [Terriglobales bacterium]|nr:hypothetical protein [Terriglobales bacterium]